MPPAAVRPRGGGEAPPPLSPPPPPAVCSLRIALFLSLSFPIGVCESAPPPPPPPPPHFPSESSPVLILTLTRSIPCHSTVRIGEQTYTTFGQDKRKKPIIRQNTIQICLHHSNSSQENNSARFLSFFLAEEEERAYNDRESDLSPDFVSYSQGSQYGKYISQPKVLRR